MKLCFTYALFDIDCLTAQAYNVSMNKLSTEKRIAVVSALVDGCSIRSTVRMTGVAKNTVTKLLVDLGQVCSEFQDRTLRNLQCQRLQLDEIWSFCYSKAKNVPEEKKDKFGYGDVWTWVAIDADTKLVPSWLVAGRNQRLQQEGRESCPCYRSALHALQLRPNPPNASVDPGDEGWRN